MNPHRMSWGFATKLPLAQFVAIAVLVGLLSTRERDPLPQTKEVFLLFAFWAMMMLSTLFAFYPADAKDGLIKISKILLMTYITVMLFQDSKKLKTLLWVIALSIGFFGLKGGVWTVLTGGQYKVLGPPDSFIAGNTEIGLALNMVLPFILFLRREEKRPWLRHFLLCIFMFSIVAIVGTYSRGALLGLLAVIFVILMRSRSKFLALLLLTVGICIALVSLPEKWFGRMETVKTYEEDPSAMGRIIAWKLSYQMAIDRPITGYGFRPFTPEIYHKYMSEYPWHADRAADAHNIFFQVLAEHGFTGFGVYIVLILSTMISLRQLIRRCNKDPALSWFYNCSQMIETSLVAFIVGGSFLSRSYFDLFFHLVAITIILKQLVFLQEQKLGETQAMMTNQPDAERTLLQ